MHMPWCPTASSRDPSGGVELVPLPAPTDDELHAVALAIVKGVLRVLAGAAERARDQDDVAIYAFLYWGGVTYVRTVAWAVSLLGIAWIGALAA